MTTDTLKYESDTFLEDFFPSVFDRNTRKRPSGRGKTHTHTHTDYIECEMLIPTMKTLGGEEAHRAKG
jgi:hypothetical protein